MMAREEKLKATPLEIMFFAMHLKEMLMEMPMEVHFRGGIGTVKVIGGYNVSFRKFVLGGHQMPPWQPWICNCH